MRQPVWGMQLFQDGFLTAGANGVGKLNAEGAVACYHDLTGGGKVQRVGIMLIGSVFFEGVVCGGPKDDRGGGGGVN